MNVYVVLLILAQTTLFRMNCFLSFFPTLLNSHDLRFLSTLRSLDSICLPHRIHTSLHHPLSVPFTRLVFPPHMFLALDSLLSDCVRLQFLGTPPTETAFFTIDIFVCHPFFNLPFPLSPASPIPLPILTSIFAFFSMLSTFLFCS